MTDAIGNVTFCQILDIAQSGADDDEVLEVGAFGNQQKTLSVAAEHGLRQRIALAGGDVSAREGVVASLRSSLAERMGAQAAQRLIHAWTARSDMQTGLVYVGNLRTLVDMVRAQDTSDTVLGGLYDAGIAGGRSLREYAGSGILTLSDAVLRAAHEAGRSEAALRSFVVQANALLSEHPYSIEGAADVIGKTAMAAFEAGEYAGIFEASDHPECREMAAKLRTLAEELNAHKNLLAEQVAGQADLTHNTRYAAKTRIKAAMAVLVDRMAAEPMRTNTAAMKALSLDLAQELAALEKRSDSTVSTKKELEDLAGMLSSLGRRIRAAAYPQGASKEQVKALKDELNEAYRQELNRAPWNTISRDIPVFDGKGGMQTLTSTMTPSNRLGNGEAMQLDGISGVGSGDRANKHASNLWSSELTVRRPDGSQKRLFLGMRHGVHDAFGIKNEALRRQANIDRVREFYTAALSAQPELLREALSGKTVRLPVVSNSLLGPNWFCKKEAKMLAHQTAAWREACPNGVCELTVGGKTVRVEPQVITFNWAVDMWSQSLGLNAWRSTRAQNEAGLTALIGAQGEGVDPQSHVGRFLAECRDEDLQQKVTLLTNQIQDMRTSGAYKKWGGDPYAMPARIALLAHLTGAMPAYNCKSGKDRTGQMDVAVKTLAFELERGTLPHPMKGIDSQSVKLMNNLAANSGNMEVQQYNTGLAGSKTAGFFSNPWGLKARFETEAFDYYRGLEDRAKS